jgi:acyl carrier protein
MKVEIDRVIEAALDLDGTPTLESHQHLEEDLGIDSLTFMSIVVAIEDQVGAEFDLKVMGNIKTVGELYEAINKLKSQQ